MLRGNVFLLHRTVLLSLFYFSSIIFFPSAYADIYTVNSTSDTLTAGSFGSVTEGELRYAITQANLNPGSTIKFDLPASSVITLGKPLPAFTATTAIDNSVAQLTTAPNLTISGNQLYPIFCVYGTPTATPAAINVSIIGSAGLDLHNGLAKGGNGGGGALGAGGAVFVNQGMNLFLTDVNFSNNQATGGNGSNSVRGGGGGLYSGTGNATGGAVNGGGGGGGVAAVGGGSGALGNDGASGLVISAPSGGAGGTGLGVSGLGGASGGGGGNGVVGGGGGGGGVGGAAGTTLLSGSGGAGGFGGGGGGASGIGGAGGFGGGGGNSGAGTGGVGGFGAGGGLSSSGTVAGGFGGGTGNATTGGGGAGFGGAVFVCGTEGGGSAGSVTITNTQNISFSGNAVSAGTGGLGNASASGTDLYVAAGVSAGFQPAANVTETLNGTIAGAGGITLNSASAGTLALAGVNTYTGATLVQGGILQVSTDNNIGLGTLTFGNSSNPGGSGTLKITAGFSSTRNISLVAFSGVGGAIVDTNGNALILTGILSGTGGLAKINTGTLTLTGTNTYSNGTTLTAGTLAIDNDSALGTGVLVLNGGALEANATHTLTNNFSLTAPSSIGGSNNLTLNPTTSTLGSHILTIDNTVGSTITLGGAGILDGTGGVNKTDAGVLVYSTPKTYTGTTTIAGGTLQADVGINNILPAASIVSLTAPTATFDLNNTNQQIGDLSSATGNGLITLGTGTLTVGTANDTSFGGVISGTGNLVKQGAGILSLTIANTYTGTTAITAGTLKAGANDVLATTSEISFSSPTATFDVNNTNQVINDISSATGNGLITLGTGTLTVGTGSFGGVISGAGNLVKQQKGILTLTAANTYAGTTAITEGVLRAGVNDVLASSSEMSFSSATSIFDVNNTNQVIKDISSTTGNGLITLGTGTLTVGTGNNKSFGGVISGVGGSVVKQGAGVLTLTAANTYTGGTTVDAGTLEVGDDSALGTGELILNGGTLQSNATHTLTNDFSLIAPSSIGGSNDLTVNSTTSTLGSNILTINNTVGSTITLGGTGALDGTGGVNKTDAGVLVYSTPKTYTGTTTIAGGTLQADVGINNILPAASIVSLTAPTAIFDLNNTNQQIGDLSSATGNGLITLGTGTLTVGTANDTSFGGVISGAGNLVKQGTGVLTLTAANIYMGTTAITAGTLKAGVNDVLATTSEMSFSSPTVTFDVNNTNQVIHDISSTTGNGLITLGTGTLTVGTGNFGGVISGAGNLVKQQKGTLTLTAANAYTGTTAIIEGALRAGVNDVLATTSEISFSSATSTFDIDNTNQVIKDISSTTGNGLITLGTGTLTVGTGNNKSFGGVISGVGGSIVKQGTGVLTLTAANTYTGGTTLDAGTLEVGDDSALGTGELVLNGGALQSNATHTLTNNFSLTAPSSIGGSNDLTVNPTTSTLGSNILTINNTVGSTITLGGLGELSGLGGVIKTNAGVLIYSTPKTYTGITRIIGGVLQAGIGVNNILPAASVMTLEAPTAIFDLNNTNQGIGDLSSTTGNGLITLGTGRLTLGTANDTSFGGVISGVGGSLVKQGSGVLTLTGANTYTGGTTVIVGTLKGDTVSVQGNILNNATVIFDQATTGVYSDVISGTGTIVKQGAGNLIVTGTNTNTGITNVNEGRLSVNGVLGLLNSKSQVNINPLGNVPTATLGGIGIINGDVNNNGIVAPGNSIGTLTINGNYNPTVIGVTSISINAQGQSSLLNVIGTANLNGFLNVDAIPGQYQNGSQYEFLVADNIVGQFSDFTQVVGPYKVQVLYTAQVAKLVLSVTPITPQIVNNRHHLFSGACMDSNLLSIANYIDNLPVPAIGSDLGDNIIGPLTNLLSCKALKDALESISAGAGAAVNSLMVQENNMLVNATNVMRMSSLRQQLQPGEEPVCHIMADTVNRKSGSYSHFKDRNIGTTQLFLGKPQQFHVTQSGVSRNAVQQLQPYSTTYQTQNGGVWLQRFGYAVDHQTQRKAPGFKGQTACMLTGFDYNVAKNQFLGVAFGHMNTTVSLHQHRGNNHFDNYVMSMYGTRLWDAFYIDGAITGGLVRYYTKQHMGFLTLHRTATGRHKAYEITPHADMGYTFKMNNKLCVTPFAGVDYGYVFDKGYVTEGALSINQEVRDRNSGLLRSEAGVKMAQVCFFESLCAKGYWMPEASVSVVNKTLLQNGRTRAGFVGQPGFYTVEYFTKARNEVAAWVGLTVGFNEYSYINARVDVEYGAGYRSKELSIKLGMRF